jgi:hypothetical protein
MNRSMCGFVVLAVVTGLWSCGGDPTESFRGGTPTILPDPSSVFVDQGASKFVLVEVSDQQGNQLAADFQAQNVGPGITVEKDTAFLRTTIGTHLETSARFLVTGVGPGSTSFDLVGAGATTTVPVRVVPTSFAATFSNPAPAVNEEITITLPPGYKFGTAAGVTTDQGTGVVRAYSADSTAITVILPPGSTSVALDSVSADFLPGVSLAGIPVETAVTADATPAAGTGATATAPTLPVPPLDDGTSVFFDVGAFTAADVTGDAGLGAQYYKFVITQAGDYTITTDWPPDSPADLDPFLCQSSGCAGTVDILGTGTDHPEQATKTLAPGTYFVAVVLFAGSAPSNFNIQISGITTPPPPAP